MPELKVDIPSSVKMALDSEVARTRGSPSSVVIAALAEYLRTSIHTLPGIDFGSVGRGHQFRSDHCPGPPGSWRFRPWHIRRSRWIDGGARRTRVSGPRDRTSLGGTAHCLFALKAVFSGRGDELVDLAKTNLFRSE